MDEGVIKMRTLGEAMGLTREKEREICKLAADTISKIKNTGNFEKSKVILELEKKGLERQEFSYVLFMAGFYSAMVETPRVIIVHNMRKQDLSADENQGYS